MAAIFEIHRSCLPPPRLLLCSELSFSSHLDMHSSFLFNPSALAPPYSFICTLRSWGSFENLNLRSCQPPGENPTSSSSLTPAEKNSVFGPSQSTSLLSSWLSNLICSPHTCQSHHTPKCLPAPLIEASMLLPQGLCMAMVSAQNCHTMASCSSPLKSQRELSPSTPLPPDAPCSLFLCSALGSAEISLSPAVRSHAD